MTHICINFINWHSQFSHNEVRSAYSKYTCKLKFQNSVKWQCLLSRPGYQFSSSAVTKIAFTIGGHKFHGHPMQQTWSYLETLMRVNMSRDMTKPTKWLCALRRLRSAWASAQSADQPGHPPSLIRVFAVRMKKAWVLSYPQSAQRRLGLDWANSKVDPSLRWAHTHFVGFVMSWLKHFSAFCCC